MKRLTTLFAFAVFAPTLFAQNLVNPYQYVSSYVAKPSSVFPSYHWDDFIRSDAKSWFDGELQVSLLNHPWGADPSFSGYAYGNSNQDVFAKSIVYELVSFPFDVPEGWPLATNKLPSANTLPLSTSTQRVLAMPAVNFDNAEMGWKYLNSSTGNWQVLRTLTRPSPFRGSPGGTPSALVKAMDTYRNALISNFFEGAWSNSSLDTPSAAACYNQAQAEQCAARRLLPHSILKMTVRLHAGTSITTPIVSSFSWVYDMTRGRMASYPFKNSNFSSGSALQHDLIFAPQLLYAGDQTYAQAQSILGKNTANNTNLSLNYTPYGSNFPSASLRTQIKTQYPIWNNYFPSALSPTAMFYDLAFNGMTDIPRLDSNGENRDNFYHNYPFAPPYSLLTSLLRNATGTALAGYISNNANAKLATAMSYDVNLNKGINHAYYIDRNIDLSTLPYPIYNPSSVNITANNLVFPSCTRFQTIRGKYPTEQEAIAANTAANGGQYSDLTQVPVPTDVSPTSDPTDASIYRIKSGGKLTIGQQLMLFDATIIVEAGGTLVYAPGAMRGRYKVINQGGTVVVQTANWDPRICTILL